MAEPGTASSTFPWPPAICGLGSVDTEFGRSHEPGGRLPLSPARSSGPGTALVECSLAAFLGGLMGGAG